MRIHEPVRAFIAIRLTPEVDAAIARFQNGLRALRSDVSWTKPDAFHLTLRFLGNRVQPLTIDRIARGLAPIAAATAPFAVQAHGAGAFPSIGRPRVIWIGLADGELSKLAAQIEALSVKCGLEPEERRFTPHLTIGRMRNPARDPRMRQALESAAELDFGSSPITSVTLYRSHLSPHGAAYEALATLPFTG